MKYTVTAEVMMIGWRSTHDTPEAAVKHAVQIKSIGGTDIKINGIPLDEINEHNLTHN